jgi:hypothetical protein
MTTSWPGLVAALGAVVLASSTTANASCAVSGLPLSLADELGAAKVVFVGSVLYTSDESRSGRVKVESIWKGPKLPAYVDVRGEAPGSGLFSGSEGDHHYQSGQQYLFVPLNDHPPFKDYGDCNPSTQLYTAALAADAPPDAKAPDPPTATDMIWNFVGQYSSPATIAGLLSVVVVSILLVSVRRRTKASEVFRR